VNAFAPHLGLKMCTLILACGAPVALSLPVSVPAVKVLVMMPFGFLLWIGSTIAFCVTVA
jgi:EamA domain-containing membrane protein RarD